MAKVVEGAVWNDGVFRLVGDESTDRCWSERWNGES